MCSQSGWFLKPWQWLLLRIVTKVVNKGSKVVNPQISAFFPNMMIFRKTNKYTTRYDLENPCVYAYIIIFIYLYIYRTYTHIYMRRQAKLDCQYMGGGGSNCQLCDMDSFRAYDQPFWVHWHQKFWTIVSWLVSSMEHLQQTLLFDWL